MWSAAQQAATKPYRGSARIVHGLVNDYHDMFLFKNAMALINQIPAVGAT
jgi:hypothetical protein